MKDMVDKMDGMLDKIGDFDDFMRPIRNYLYWYRHDE